MTPEEKQRAKRTKERGESMKKKLAVLAIILICLSSVSMGTMAYFTAEETAHNIITTSGIDIELEEWTDEGKPFEDVSGVVPGAQISKIVQVRNTGETSAYVRVKVDETFSFAVKGEEEVDWSLITIDYNVSDWTLEDGYYYYDHVLKSGEATVPLFTKVSFAKEMGNAYQNGQLVIDVTAYATQVANNGESALTAKSWTEAGE